MRKISWILKRHSFLYSARFRLLSRNSTKEEVLSETYNSHNSVKDIPEIYSEINKEIFKNVHLSTDLEKALHISSWLRKHVKGGSGLSLPSDLALHKMLAGEGGVCSDVSQVFNNFCVINDILVKEWGITVFPFDKKYGGHAANEVFCKTLKKWVLIDVSKCIIFYRTGIKEPLSTLEIFDTPKDFKFHPFCRDIKDDEQIKIYYFNEAAVPFLICDYKNKIYDRFLRPTAFKIPVFIIHFFVYMTGHSYHYKFPLNDYKTMFS